MGFVSVAVVGEGVEAGAAADVSGFAGSADLAAAFGWKENWS